MHATVTRYWERPALQSVPAAGQVQAEPGATVQTTRYRYDALGRRVDKTDAFGRTRFVYDGDLLAGEIRGSKVSEYLYEPDSFVPLAKLESEAKQAPAQIPLGHIATKDVANEKAEDKDFAIYYYQCDQIGAPQELTDEAGRIVWAASYKVWGQTQALQMLRTGNGTDGEAVVFTANERPLALAASGEVQSLNLVEQPLRFQGQYFDGETGLHYNRFRYYDPVTGRFVHQDPIGLFGGTNFFVYAANTSGWLDPFGLAKRSGPGIREKLYPSRVRKKTRTELEEKQKGSDGNIACAICSCQLGPGNTSVQHSPPLVETHNNLGFNTDQAGRNDLYNSTADSLVCLPCQKAEGGTMSHTQQYRTDTGPQFKPRKSRRKDGC
ncbi:RHS domain-containing protein [Acidovorax sp. GBBC 1281]|nr:RHS repeat-associated core domain-containing protein [Acidovorax sp. GBBC 1281]WCM98909.1 RHS domain-containing protein [Acidovorax sp. GBBC 1281]